jgi:hypothetical protein
MAIVEVGGASQRKNKPGRRLRSAQVHEPPVQIADQDVEFTPLPF